MLAIAKPHLPSPNPVFGQLNDGVFYSLVFNDMRPPVSERDIRQNDDPVCPLVNLTIPQALEHDPEKACPARDAGWVPVFPRDKRDAFARRSCSDKKIERDDDSKKSHPALELCFQMAATTISLSWTLLFRGLQLTLKPLNRIGFEGVGAGAFEALELARTLTPGREGKHHRRAALRTRPGLVGLSHA